MEISFWYCANGSGQAKIFVTKPVRNAERNIWVGGTNVAVIRFFDWLETECGFELQDISWLDEPVQIDLKIGEPYEESDKLLGFGVY